MSRSRPDSRATYLAALLFVCLGGATAPAACESYYLIVFAYQGCPNLARDSHSFATFIKVAREPIPQGERCWLEYHTISWLPVDCEVKVYTVIPEAGRNYDLEETLEIATIRGYRLSYFGPYEIKKTLYDRSLKQLHHLENERVKYKAIDSLYPTPRVCNCIHAVSDLVLLPARLRVGTPAYGEAASYRILLRLSRFLIKPAQTHDWILEALGLNAYPMTQRHLKQFWLWFPRPGLREDL